MTAREVSLDTICFLIGIGRYLTKERCEEHKICTEQTTFGISLCGFRIYSQYRQRLLRWPDISCL